MAHYNDYADYDDQRDYDDKRDSGRRRDHRQKMSREQAENVLEVEARFRDFWYLDNGEDNRDLLQDAIDIVYNTIPGNDYNIDYMECQNSCRLKVRCLTCNVELTGYDPFITHEKGKPHKKVRQQRICIKDPNIQTSLKKQPHNLPKGIFEPDSLEDMIDHCKDTILGVHFLYKEIKERPYFTCTLCHTKKGSKVRGVCKNKMYKHLLGNTHNETYMSVKFGIYPNNGFSDVLAQYERFEGKIHASIIDFTNQMVLEVVKKEEIKMEEEIKFKPFPVKRERSPPSEYFKRKFSRVASPEIFVKKEIRSPSISPIREIPPEIVPPVTASVSFRDAETMTGSEIRRGSAPIFQLLEESGNLKLPGACELLRDDPYMLALLCQGVITLNRKIALLFKSQGTMCWDDKGEVVNIAYDCAMNLERKHLDELKMLIQEML
ncbi:uncharacterized protein [Macrobrachium rosenbergii]